MGTSEVDSAVEVFVDGFAEDPWFRWLWPGQDEYAECAAAWFRLVTEAAVDRSELILAGDGAAAGLWTPPGATLADDTRLAMKTALLLRSQLGDRAEEATAALQASAACEPEGPHYSCVYVAVAARARGRGLGAEVMRGPLATCDDEGVGASLSSTNGRNVAFYRRLGFEVTDVAPAAGGEVEFRQMWRGPAAG